jgi:hypothetical protein
MDARERDVGCACTEKFGWARRSLGDACFLLIRSTEFGDFMERLLGCECMKLDSFTVLHRCMGVYSTLKVIPLIECAR